MRYLLDTCVISEAVKERPSPDVLEWLSAVDETRLFLSVLTLGEIQKGVSALPAGKRQARLQNWLDNDLMARFDGRILPITNDIATDWGLLSGRARHKGYSAPVIDALLAATARHHDLVLVTRNVGDFEPLGVNVVNPWEGE